MPSKSRKKIKGQTRKAKAKAAAAAASTNTATVSTLDTNNSICNHGGDAHNIPTLCRQFVATFFACLLSLGKGLTYTNNSLVNTVITALSSTYNNFPETLHNENYRDTVKKNLVSNGAYYLLEENEENSSPSRLPLAFAMAVMLIDSYDPSSPVPAGTFDTRDAKNYLRNSDILNGCKRSLVKYFVNKTPCKCLDELYSQVRSTKSKMSSCFNCGQKKQRSNMFICTGCERGMYCSKACQIAHVPEHKDDCKKWQERRQTPLDFEQQTRRTV